MGRSMVQKAIRIGNRLGINLTEGVLVEASGNCLLESVKGGSDGQVMSFKAFTVESLV